MMVVTGDDDDNDVDDGGDDDDVDDGCDDDDNHHHAWRNNLDKLMQWKSFYNSFSDVYYYIIILHCLGGETSPKLDPGLLNDVQKFILIHNLSPVKVSCFSLLSSLE